MISSDISNWNALYKTGAICTILILFGIIFDIIAGSIVSGGDLSTLPVTALDRFDQFSKNAWLGLYNLDLLNLVTQLLMVPVYLALYAAHRESGKPFALLALIIFLIGTSVFTAVNTALPMLDLSNKFQATNDPESKRLLTAAGEALLARGAHGSPGVFLSFFLPNVAGLLMSVVMLQSRIFSRLTAYLGIAGSIMMMIYTILVNFIPGMITIAMIIAMPGGLLLMAFMILYSIRLLRLAKSI